MKEHDRIGNQGQLALRALFVSHSCDKKRNIVDLAIEDRHGCIVGIEVKASATRSQIDFSGLNRIADVHGDNFVLNLALRDHDNTLIFGDRLLAGPNDRCRFGADHRTGCPECTQFHSPDECGIMVSPHSPEVRHDRATPFYEYVGIGSRI